MTTTPTTTPTNPGWRIQLAIHRAVRRDAGRLSAALAEGREASPAAVRAYWRAMGDQLHHHHVFEDTVVWPLMRERLGGRADALLDRNVVEHVAMAAAMEELGRVVETTTDTAAARVALAKFEEAVETHLVHEERDVLPLIPETFTPEDLAFFQAESAKTNPGPAFLPWLLDGAPDADIEFFTGSMPAPVRAELESSWTPRWQATVDALRVSAEAPLSVS